MSLYKSRNGAYCDLFEDCLYHRDDEIDLWIITLKEKQTTAGVPLFIKVRGKNRTVKFFNHRHDHANRYTLFKATDMVLYYMWNDQ